MDLEITCMTKPEDIIFIATFFSLSGNFKWIAYLIFEDPDLTFFSLYAHFCMCMDEMERRIDKYTTTQRVLL